MRLQNIVFLFFATNNSYRMLCFKSFVFTCLTYKTVQRFRNGPVHEFYGLKDSQMSKVCAQVLKNTQVEKIKNLCEQNFKGLKGTLGHISGPHDPQLCHGKRNNLAAKRKTKNFTAKGKRLTAKRITSRQGEDILFAAGLFLFAVRFFLFAGRLFFLL